jgi:hypothetical protein
VGFTPTRHLSKLGTGRLTLLQLRERIFRKRHGSHRRRGPSPPRNRGIVWRIIARGTVPGEAHGLLAAWQQWDRIAHRLWPLEEIPGAPYGVLMMRAATADGDASFIANGTSLGDSYPVCELHCNNLRILEIVGAGQMSPYTAARADLRALAKWCSETPEGREIRALSGFTILAGPASRLGFELRECPHTIGMRFERFFMRGLLLIYSPMGLERLAYGKTGSLFPHHIWMPRRDLLRMYGIDAPNVSL